MTSASRKTAIARLRRHIETLERPLLLKEEAGGQTAAQKTADAIALLPGALQEARAADWRDGPAAAAFSLALAGACARHTGKAVVSVQLAHEAARGGAPFARGLTSLGVRLPGFVAAFTRDSKMLLWAIEEAARCKDVAAVIAEAPRDCALLDLTATRRLHLAASSSGAAAILIRKERAAAPTAAMQRWRVRPAPSREASFDAKAAGDPRWLVELERCRKGGRGAWLVEMRNDALSFVRQRTVSEPLPAALADGPAETAA